MNFPRRQAKKKYVRIREKKGRKIAAVSVDGASIYQQTLTTTKLEPLSFQIYWISLREIIKNKKKTDPDIGKHFFQFF